MENSYSADNFERVQLRDVAHDFSKKNQKEKLLGAYSDFDGTYAEKVPHKTIDKGGFLTDTGVGFAEKFIEKGLVSQELFERELLPEIALDCLNNRDFGNESDRARELQHLHGSLIERHKKGDYEGVAGEYLKIQQELVWLEDEYLVPEYGVKGKQSFYRLLEGLERGEIRDLGREFAGEIKINKTLHDVLALHDANPKVKAKIITANMMDLVLPLLEEINRNSGLPISAVKATEMIYENKYFTPMIEIFNNSHMKVNSILADKSVPLMVAGDTSGDVPMMGHLLRENKEGYVTAVYPKGKDPEKVADYFIENIKKVLGNKWKDSMKGRIFVSEFNGVPLKQNNNTSEEEL